MYPLPCGLPKGTCLNGPLGGLLPRVHFYLLKFFPSYFFLRFHYQFLRGWFHLLEGYYHLLEGCYHLSKVVVPNFSCSSWFIESQNWYDVCPRHGKGLAIGTTLKNIKVGIFVAIKIGIDLITKVQNMNIFGY